MQWRVSGDQSMGLVGGADALVGGVGDLADALRDSGTAGGADIGSHLGSDLRSGRVQESTLVGLGALCHGRDASREPARDVSQALFGFVLPTPTVSGHEYVWRVARRLGRQGGGAIEDAPMKRIMQHRTFRTRAEAAAFATETGETVCSVSEGPQEGRPAVTVWFWEG